MQIVTQPRFEFTVKFMWDCRNPDLNFFYTYFTNIQNVNFVHFINQNQLTTRENTTKHMLAIVLLKHFVFNLIFNSRLLSFIIFLWISKLLQDTLLPFFPVLHTDKSLLSNVLFFFQ